MGAYWSSGLFIIFRSGGGTPASFYLLDFGNSGRGNALLIQNASIIHQPKTNQSNIVNFIKSSGFCTRLRRSNQEFSMNVNRHLAYYFQMIDVSLAMRQYVLFLTLVVPICHQKKPRQAVSIAAWIKLDTNKGYHSIFDTVGGHSVHKNGQYHFEVQDGSVRWFHRNESGNQIFSVETGTFMENTHAKI